MLLLQTIFIKAVSFVHIPFLYFRIILCTPMYVTVMYVNFRNKFQFCLIQSYNVINFKVLRYWYINGSRIIAAEFRNDWQQLNDALGHHSVNGNLRKRNPQH